MKLILALVIMFSVAVDASTSTGRINDFDKNLNWIMHKFFVRI